MSSESDELKKLNASDVQSPVWVKLRKHMQARLQALRISNDSTDLDPVATARVRGEIKNLKNLLALGKPDPAMVADEEPAD